MKTLILFSFFGLLILISWSDYRKRQIPDRMVLLLLLTGIVWQIFVHEPGVASGVAGMLVAGLPLLLISLLRRGAFGGGDIKLMAAAGMFLGVELAMKALFMGFIFGGLYGLICLLLKVKGRKDTFAFGSFLCLGIVVAFFVETVEFL